jgi:hypothetical protein
MKGHLNAKQLEKYNKEDLEKLATELGVSTEGTKKDIAARCAEIEVELPDTDGQQNTQQPASGLVKVACIQNYKDLQFDRIVETGEEYEVTPERAALLLEKNLVKRA